jgi:acyl-CoA synthetase (NDP forming)
MMLSPDELRTARAALAQLVIRQRRAREVTPRAVLELLRHLDDVLTGATSVGGNGTRLSAKPSVYELDSTEEAAVIGVSTRRVRQIAEQLGGRQVGGRWLFERAAIEEHADGRH